ncbi:zinc-ribbon domain-containing protein [Paenibacillus kobensis]|uniref:zinc-ribbon domain-containing protein n=1 Tax=Paenibacillus kobensis TaxID=59841 RepID=UPI0013E3C259|nr:zinc-ribbon domain-containing protein [Paenibacillus kobensis]
MYCANCGSELANDDRFCGNCGESVPSNVKPALSIPQKAITIPKLQLSKRAKVAAAGVVGVVGILAAIYAVAHYTYGPATPEKLEAKLQAAVEEQNVDKLVGYLSYDNEDLKSSEKIKAFKQAFKDETATEYKEAIKDALIAVQQSEQMSELGFDEQWGNGGTIVFIKESNWRGTKWSFKIEPSNVTFEQQPDWTVVTSLETLGGDTGTIRGIWPAVYEYQSEISNPYGGKQNIQGSVNLFHDPEETVNLESEVQNEVTFSIPVIKGVQFTLNGVDFPAMEEGQTRVTISPAPDELKLAVKGTVIGRTIDRTETLTGSEAEEISLSTLVSQAIAEDAVGVILKANVSWTKAVNAGLTSLLTDLEPDSSIMNLFSRNITEGGSEQKVHLERVAIDPTDIEISDDHIQVIAEEEYSYPGSTLSNNLSRNTYTIKKQQDQDRLWLSDVNYTYYWGKSLFEQKDVIIKINQDKPETGKEAAVSS